MFWGGSYPELKITWGENEASDLVEGRSTVLVPTADDVKVEEEQYLFSNDDDSISGRVEMKLPRDVSSHTHGGIVVELIGQVELEYDRGNHFVFLSKMEEICGAGKISKSQGWDFKFENVSLEYETYIGSNVRLRYFVRARAKSTSSFYSDIQTEAPFAVQIVSEKPDTNNVLKMEVGIEDCLHIEFKYDRSKYYLRDVIIGRINFLLVRIKIKHMEMQILKRESTGTGPNLYNETEVVTKFEIMDGAPVKNTLVPIRLFLKQHKLTPTFKQVHSKFSVKYYLNLVLVDEEDRRYFKQQEIVLWRKGLKAKETMDELTGLKIDSGPSKDDSVS